MNCKVLQLTRTGTIPVCSRRYMTGVLQHAGTAAAAETPGTGSLPEALPHHIIASSLQC